MRFDLQRLRESGFKPRFHPNGFIQLDLNPTGTVRLHVWPQPDSGLKKQASDNNIHDHIFDMESRVLAGKLTNVAYTLTLVGEITDPDPQFTKGVYEIYKANYPTPKGNSFLSKTDKKGLLNVVDRVTMTAGSEYYFGAFHFHESIATELTATVMRKKVIYAASNPRVLARYGETPDMAFSRFQNPEELMWAQINKVMVWHIGSFEVPDDHLNP